MAVVCFADLAPGATNARHLLGRQEGGKAGAACVGYFLPLGGQSTGLLEAREQKRHSVG